MPPSDRETTTTSATAPPGGTSTTTLPAVIGAPGASSRPDGDEPGDGPPGSVLPAGELEPPGNGPSIAADRSLVRPGDTLRLTGRGLAGDGTTFELVIGELVVAGRLVPGRDGSLTVDLVLPEGIIGTQTLGLRPTGSSDVIASTTVTVDPSPAATLPVATIIVGLGALLLLALVLGIRRRRIAPVQAASTNEAVADVRSGAATTPATATVSGPADTAPESGGVSRSDVAIEEPTAPPAAEPPVVALMTARSPWSRHPLDGLAGALATGDLRSWHGALWLTVESTIAGVQHVRVWSSLNGITWSEPTTLGIGASPRFIDDRSQLGVVADRDGPCAWVTLDGETWRGLASGDPGQPRGELTAATSLNGLAVIGCRTETGGALWLGRRDGEWITIDIGMTPHVFGTWSGRTIVIGTTANGSPLAAETDAGIRWRPIPLDVPPSFGSFRPRSLLAVDGQAILLGTDVADGVADAWVSTNGAAWDPAPIGAAADSSVCDGATVDGAVLAAGSAGDGGAVWRTTHGIRWRRIDEPDDFAGIRVCSIAVYEERPHVLAVDETGRPLMWIRQPWNAAPAAGPDDDSVGLRLVISEEAPAERPA